MHTARRSALAGVLALALGLVAAPAVASTVAYIDQETVPSAFAGALQNTSGPIAQAITPASTGHLESITLHHYASTGLPASATLHVVTDASNTPGSPVTGGSATIALGTSAGDPTPVILTFPDRPMLAEDTTYQLVIDPVHATDTTSFVLNLGQGALETYIKRQTVDGWEGAHTGELPLTLRMSAPAPTPTPTATATPQIQSDPLLAETGTDTLLAAGIAAVALSAGILALAIGRARRISTER